MQLFRKSYHRCVLFAPVPSKGLRIFEKMTQLEYNDGVKPKNEETEEPDKDSSVDATDPFASSSESSEDEALLQVPDCNFSYLVRRSRPCLHSTM